MGSATGNWYTDKRRGGLLRFAIAITVLNILGHTVLGFEQAWLHPLVALATAYTVELALHAIDARAHGRRPAFLGGGVKQFIEFLLPAHITALAVAMLLYAGERFAVIAFAAATAIASKYLFTAVIDARASSPSTWRRRHFLNPSNFGITLTLLIFPWVGIAPPYQFTENVRGVFDVVLPLIIVVTGSLLNTKFTGRMPLIVAWLSAFAFQAVLRSALHGTPLLSGLVPITGLAFVLFTFYMVTDPGTTPSGTRGQVAFGVAVALTYGALVSLHVAFGLFFALTIVTGARGLMLMAESWGSVLNIGKLGGASLAPTERA